MKILGIIILLAVGSKAGINKLFFSHTNINITCPGEGTFYQWKKYYKDQMTNLLSDDKRTLIVPLNADFSPIAYECSGTNGFINYKDNITIFVLDKNSAEARKLCFMTTSPTAQYPCFLYDQKDSIISVSKGDSVELNCEAGGINVSYIWYRLNTPDSHQELMYNYANIPVLKIFDIDEKLAGPYLCIVNATSGNNLKRYFNLQIIKNKSINNIITITDPSITNITSQLHKSQMLTCKAESPETYKLHSIQWAKKIDEDTSNLDKSTIVKWGDSLYKLLPETNVQTNRQMESIVLTSLEIRSVTMEDAGQYVCAFITNNGKMKYKTFFVKVDENQLPDGSQRSFLFLYILIPSLIIAICLFVGVYLTINRRSVRKASSMGTGTSTSNCCKSENEAMRLRVTPECSMNSYPTSAPPTSQYMMKPNYATSYYPVPDKMIL